MLEKSNETKKCVYIKKDDGLKRRLEICTKALGFLCQSPAGEFNNNDIFFGMIDVVPVR